MIQANGGNLISAYGMFVLRHVMRAPLFSSVQRPALCPTFSQVKMSLRKLIAYYLTETMGEDWEWIALSRYVNPAFRWDNYTAELVIIVRSVVKLALRLT